MVVVIEQGGAGSASAAPVARKILEAFFHVPSVPSPALSVIAPAQEEPAGEGPPDAGGTAGDSPAATIPLSSPPISPDDQTPVEQHETVSD